MIKLASPNISESAIEAVADVLRSGNLVQGQECQLFEQELASYLDAKHVVLVSSGTAALHVSLIALDIGPGDAVLVPDFTFPATANAVVMTGATPVLVDVDLSSYNISIEALSEVITSWKGPEKLKAIIPVHEFGLAADIDSILSIASEHSLKVIEDAACALGALYKDRKVGTIGDIGCFSFHPRKTITTGEGGAIVTDDDNLAQRLRTLRNHGMVRTVDGMSFVEASTNYRMTDFQAVLGRHQLPNLDIWIAARQRLANEYAFRLDSLVRQGFIKLPQITNGHSCQTFMVLLSDKVDRAKLIAKLKDDGIETNTGAQCLSELGLYNNKVRKKSSNAYCLSKFGLALPLYEKLTLEDISEISYKLEKAIKELL